MVMPIEDNSSSRCFEIKEKEEEEERREEEEEKEEEEEEEEKEVEGEEEKASGMVIPGIAESTKGMVGVCHWGRYITGRVTMRIEWNNEWKGQIENLNFNNVLTRRDLTVV
ncbi:hypothetical protein HZH66_007893 [Vespula vulgaris]|uniref:Uncharacterized protein n=1 Tax=Vespula vulgaris TaxID=7454 RepID=A0A834JU66_VESVU|nr:hypothetical protein HZH66_007893 [Vespula vulgaris]